MHINVRTCVELLKVWSISLQYFLGTRTEIFHMQSSGTCYMFIANLYIVCRRFFVLVLYLFFLFLFRVQDTGH